MWGLLPPLEGNHHAVPRHRACKLQQHLMHWDCGLHSSLSYHVDRAPDEIDVLPLMRAIS